MKCAVFRPFVSVFVATVVLGACRFEPPELELVDAPEAEAPGIAGPGGDTGLALPESDAGTVAEGPAIDGSVDGPVDGSVDGPEQREPQVVPHLPGAATVFGDLDLDLGSATVDTSLLTISGVSPPVPFRSVAQEGGGPDVAVLSVAALHIKAGATVRVVGARPLIILAAGDVHLEGTLAAGGDGDTPGSGGEQDARGAGADGAAGGRLQGADVGGGGAGASTAGGPGGGAGEPGPGAAGASYMDASLAILVGGARGGRGSEGQCGIIAGPVGGAAERAAGGTGGGAVQIASQTSIVISGSIDVGGAAGAGGVGCRAPPGTGNGGSGGGGGSGGVIDLQAPVVAIRSGGSLTAHGGGGGGGANSGRPGQSGRDGTRVESASPGAGGQALAPFGLAGGAGGAGAVEPTAGEGSPSSAAGTNGGGGGGAAGRIRVIAPGGIENDGLISPGPTD